MGPARTVTGLTADVDAGPGSMEGISLCNIILLQICGMTVRTHGIPVHGISCPMQPIAVTSILLRIQGKPLPFSGIPGNIQNLQLSLSKINQILLQRLPSKGICNLILFRTSVGSGSLNHE